MRATCCANCTIGAMNSLANLKLMLCLLLGDSVAPPNAGPQEPPMAGARYERRLLAVACRPWFGGGHGEPSRSKARKPACWKCSSVVRASVRPRSCMTRNETQSVSPHPTLYQAAHGTAVRHGHRVAP